MEILGQDILRLPGLDLRHATATTRHARRSQPLSRCPYRAPRRAARRLRRLTDAAAHATKAERRRKACGQKLARQQVAPSGPERLLEVDDGLAHELRAEGAALARAGGGAVGEEARVEDEEREDVDLRQ